MRQIYTDLALEAREMAGDMAGIESEIEREGEITINNVRVTNDAASKAIGKPIGEYITVEAERLAERSMTYEEDVAKEVAVKLRKLLGRLKKEDTVLVVGLGNHDMTPDSLGPRTIDKIMVTRHIYQFLPEEVDERMRPVSAIAPGVLGSTGVETAEMVKGVADRVNPLAIIIIDALAARRIERIGTTFQMSNTGITPGSGVGNKRRAINEQWLHCPVIAIGVPLVSYAYTIAIDAITGIAQEMGIEESAQLESAAERVLKSSAGEMVVTPKEIDLLVEDSSRVIANAINMALHDGISMEEVVRFMH